MAIKEPISSHVLSELNRIAQAPVPRSTINPGVVGKLITEGLATITDAVSPFPSHKGRWIQHLKMTSAGRALILWGEKACPSWCPCININISIEHGSGVCEETRKKYAEYNPANNVAKDPV